MDAEGLLQVAQAWLGWSGIVVGVSCWGLVARKSCMIEGMEEGNVC